MISVAHLAPSPEGKDPFDREAVPPGPVEDSQSESDLEDGKSYEIERIIQHKEGRNGKFKYMIKWKGYGHEHNQWKSEWQLRKASGLITDYWKVKSTDKTASADTDQPAKRPRSRPPKNPVTTEILAPTVESSAEQTDPPQRRGLPRKVKQ